MTMALDTTAWDPIEDFESSEDELAYLMAAFEDGSSEVVAAALGDVVRARGASVVAGQAGVSRETLYKALAPSGNPTLSTIIGVFKALGFKLTLDSKAALQGARTEPGTSS